MPNSFGMDRTIQLLNILLPGIDFIPVAGKYVKASLELTVTICELAKVSSPLLISICVYNKHKWRPQKVSANKEKLINLALYIARLLIAIAMECQKVGMASSGLNVGQLVELQRYALALVDAISSAFLTYSLEYSKKYGIRLRQ
jgi:hypothetical protein